MKVDLTKPLKGLGEKEISEESAGVILANYMMNELSSAEPMRFFEIAMRLIEDKEIELSDEDHELLVKVIENGNLSNIVKAKLLMKLKAVG